MNIRIDPEPKKKAKALLSQFDITLSDVFNITLRKSLMVGGLPFGLRLPEPNVDTIAAMKEAEAISRDPSVKGYASVGPSPGQLHRVFVFLIKSKYKLLF